MQKTTTAPNLEEEIKNLTQDLLTHMQIQSEVNVKAEEPDHYQVMLDTAESGLLIGRHGETLNSLQLLLGVILYKKIGTWVHIVLDVGDYRRMREESIKDMVTRIITEVESTGQPVTLPYLTPLERRIVHLMLTGHEHVMSESTGEGKDRRVTVRIRV